MSSKLPSVRGKELVRALERAGFCVDRQTGSHVILEHPDGRFASVPVHSGRDLAVGTLRAILARAGIDERTLRALLR